MTVSQVSTSALSTTTPCPVLGRCQRVNRSQELKTYLQSINQDLAEDIWQLTCTRLAPNALLQNPVEDIWLQAKRFIRHCYHLCSSFAVVKFLFEFITHRQVFDFHRLSMYGVFSLII